MSKIYLLVLAALAVIPAFSQNSLRVQIKDKETDELLVGAVALVQGTTNGSTAGNNGIAELKNIPNGKQVIVFKHLGYKPLADTLRFPLADSSLRVINLKPDAENLDEIVVTSTRTSRTVADIPTRIEAVAGEELAENTASQPSNVKMILTETTGVQTQQTSAASASTSIRIQGLSGKYTQLLRDGFPLYNGFSGGLSILQITPLDLQRVELIKGSSSTLYGGGAIAGLVNFISKVPVAKKELSFLINANQTNAQDISAFYSQKFKRIGITLLASQNIQAAYDVNHDGLSDIPKFNRYTFNPKLYYYINNSATLSLGINSMFENRMGGDMRSINHPTDSADYYFEKNISSRVSSQLKFEKKFEKGVLTLKNSVGFFHRNLSKPGFAFVGDQTSSFSEVSYLHTAHRMEWVLGGNIWTDHFHQTNFSQYPLDNNLVIGGIFAQNIFNASEKLTIESGLRGDATSQNNFFALPRVNVMYKPSRSFTTRIGGGLGYKAPTLFSEEAEERGFSNIQPLDYNQVKPEKSIGGNFDINYKTVVENEEGEPITVAFNQLFFYTRVDNPLVLGDTPLANGNYAFSNANGYLDSRGFESSLKLGFDDLTIYCGYTFIDAVRHFDYTNTINPLTARNRIYSNMMYEIDEKLRLGFELFYTGQQTLSDGTTRPDYWIMGASAEYRFKHFSIFTNAENFTDVRQTRFESIYTGTMQNPMFKDIWAPTDGFIINWGVKLMVW
jgi:iron complex outermembrane receptor protein